MTLVDSLPHNGPGIADIVVETILLFFCYVTLGLRLWSRRIKGIRWQLNDYLIIVATILMTGRYVNELLAIFLGGLGLHVQEVAAVAGTTALSKLLQIVYIADLLWVTITTLVKLSILHFYLSVFHIEKKFVYACYFTMALCAAYWIGCFFSFAFFCTPVEKIWHPALPGHCGEPNSKYIASASIDLAVDIIIIVLPMPIIWTLQMPLGRKVGLIGVFAIGLFIIAITAVRFKFFVELDFNDLTYGFWRMALFSALVPLLGIISANIPIIPPAFQRIFRTNVLATQVQSNTGGSSSAGFSKKKGGDTFNETEFERLSDPEIPLVEVHGNRYPGKESPNGEGDRIKITTGWSVHSTIV
ncbi:hypothetical protein CC80DRAFT_599299 [Byssothecium circinans]|uniref:Rhodopsin domain-containing protein n=1 Tax=Byssothecium circinans TaxID=147558 RepID=A0A6A5T9X8_9PLEO|nr:hypothetical protein CC80DRAFT_599299 [Byssothecium circinans]